VTLPGWVGVREPWGRLGGRYAKNVTICPTLACTTPPRPLGFSLRLSFNAYRTQPGLWLYRMVAHKVDVIDGHV